MIKIGNAFLDEEFRWGISPAGCASSNKYVAILQNGTILTFNAKEAEVEAAMLKISGVECTQGTIRLSESERAELTAAANAGCVWITKDMRGIAEAFIDIPVYEAPYWNASADERPMRLFEGYNWLTPEHGPVLISDLIEGAGI